MSVRWVTFFLWAVVAASLVAWGLKLFVTPAPAPRDVRIADASAALRGDMLRVLGADAAPAAAGEGEAVVATTDSRFQLIGVVAPRKPGSGGGVALIAVDGKPPRAYRAGAAIDGQTVLKTVRARGADLGPRDGAATIALEIPPPAPAATGTLPGVNSAAPGVPLPPPAIPQAVPVPPPQPAVVMPNQTGRMQQPGLLPSRAPTVTPAVPQPPMQAQPPADAALPQPVIPSSGMPRDSQQIR